MGGRPAVGKVSLGGGGWGKWGSWVGFTAVVLDAHGDCGFADGGGDVRWVGGVDVDEVVGGRVVGGAGGYAEEVFVCHGR